VLHTSLQSSALLVKRSCLLPPPARPARPAPSTPRLAARAAPHAPPPKSPTKQAPSVVGAGHGCLHCSLRGCYSAGVPVTQQAASAASLAPPSVYGGGAAPDDGPLHSTHTPARCPLRCRVPCWNYLHRSTVPCWQRAAGWRHQLHGLPGRHRQPHAWRHVQHHMHRP